MSENNIPITKVETIVDVSRLSLLTSSLKKNENETAVLQSLSSDRRIVEEVLTIELVDMRWSSTRT